MEKGWGAQCRGMEYAVISISKYEGQFPRNVCAPGEEYAL